MKAPSDAVSYIVHRQHHAGLPAARGPFSKALKPPLPRVESSRSGIPAVTGWTRPNGCRHRPEQRCGSSLSGDGNDSLKVAQKDVSLLFHGLKKFFHAGGALALKSAARPNQQVGRPNFAIFSFCYSFLLFTFSLSLKLFHFSPFTFFLLFTFYFSYFFTFDDLLFFYSCFFLLFYFVKVFM